MPNSRSRRFVGVVNGAEPFSRLLVHGVEDPVSVDIATDPFFGVSFSVDGVDFPSCKHGDELLWVSLLREAIDGALAVFTVHLTRFGDAVAILEPVNRFKRVSVRRVNRTLLRGLPGSR